MIKWTKHGLNVSEKQNAREVAYLLRQEKRMKSLPKAVGCNFGFRQHAGLVSRRDQQAIEAGENSRLVFALIQNGKHPAYQNH